MVGVEDNADAVVLCHRVDVVCTCYRATDCCIHLVDSFATTKRSATMRKLDDDRTIRDFGCFECSIDR